MSTVYFCRVRKINELDPLARPLSFLLLLKVREWFLDAAVRSARVDGGPAGGETLLLGLENGAVLQVLVSNAFPIELVKTTAPVICCTMSLHRKKASHETAGDGASERVLMVAPAYNCLSADLVFRWYQVLAQEVTIGVIWCERLEEGRQGEEYHDSLLIGLLSIWQYILSRSLNFFEIYSRGATSTTFRY